MLTDAEIIALMNRRKSSAHIPQMREIYRKATGKDWRGCFCGNGFDRFYNTCKIYANQLQAKINKENLIITDNNELQTT